MSITNLSNSSIEFDIAGKTYKVKKLSVLDIYTKMESEITKEYIKTMGEFAKVLPDKDRPEFLRNAIKEQPTGKRMEDMVNEKISSIQGGIDILHLILNKCQPISIEEVTALVSDEKNSSDISSIMSFAFGGAISKDEATTGEPTEKK